MTFYGKFILFVSTIIQTTPIICFPHSYDQFDYSGKSYAKNYITNAFQSNQIINTEQPICRKFHFPETEYPLASISDIPLNFQEIEKKTYFKTQINTNSQLKSNPKNYINMNYKNHDIGTLSNRHANDFLSSSRHCDIGNFPDIEYPMSASELWKPYYWGCQNNFQTLYTEQPLTYPKLNHTTTRKDLSNNFGELSTRRKTHPVSNKSFSDPKKTLMMLKNNQQNKNISIQKYNESIKLIKHQETVCKTTESQITPFNKSRTLHPNYHMQIIQSNLVAENKSINNFDSIHRKSSILPTKEKFHNISLSEMENVNSDYKLKATENAMKSYTERFNTEMSAVLKNIADKIVLNDYNQFERNIYSPNIYLMNYEDDSFYEIPTENDVTLYANEFNNKMTSIIKSVADNILLKNTDAPNINTYTDASDSIDKRFKSDIERTFKDSEKTINTYADRFNDEMSSILNSNFEDIILDDVNFMKENPLHSNIKCPLKNDEVCKSTDLFDLRNRTLPKQKSDTILVLDDINKNSDKEMFTNVVKTKHEDSYEDYTTDAYPEPDNFWSLYSQSTVAPEISSVDATWKSSKVIEPDNASNSEELGQYFMLV